MATFTAYVASAGAVSRRIHSQITSNIIAHSGDAVVGQTYYMRAWDPDNSRYCYWQASDPSAAPASVSPPATIANLQRKIVRYVQ